MRYMPLNTKCQTESMGLEHAPELGSACGEAANKAADEVADGGARFASGVGNVEPKEMLLDELDRLIIQDLQEDGRTPFTQIARRAGVSQTTIRSRFQRLFDAGIIRIAGVVDPYALDFQAPAIVGVSVEPGMIDHVARKIIEFPEVSYLVVTLGNLDLIIEVFCRDLPHLSELITQQIHSIPGVRSTQTLMITRSYKLGYRVPTVLASLEESK